MMIGESIKQARKSKGLSQKELGERLHVSQAMIAQYEKGSRNPKIETVKKIADALNVPFEYLMYGNQEKTGENIRYYRDRQELSVEELSEKTNIPLERLKAYESDLDTPTEEEIFKISQALFLMPGELTAIQGMKYDEEWNPVKKSPDERRQSELLRHYEKLNNKGRDEAGERIRELSHVPEFQRE